jgi:hypothetical protein
VNNVGPGGDIPANNLLAPYWFTVQEVEVLGTEKEKAQPMLVLGRAPETAE